jgi:transposase
MMWVPPEDKDPVTWHAPTRKSAALFGAVNVLSGKFVYINVPKFNALTFRIFLGKLLRHRKRSRKMAVILDNSRYHHATMLNPFIEKHRDHLLLDFLPPYSPELNPIERIWKLTRKLCTHNQYFQSLEDLIKAVSSQLDLCNKPNDLLAKLCCIT